MNSASLTTSVEKAAGLFAAARSQVADDFGENYVGLPPATPDGLGAADAVFRSRPDLSIALGRLLLKTADIPAASRRRRLLGALACWLPRASHQARRQEKWFPRDLVANVATASGGAASGAEVAALIVLAALKGLGGPN